MPTRAKKMDAIALLKADHRKVEDLFEQFAKARASDRKKALAEQICLELSVHAKIEEDIFYPACREAGVGEAKMNEANVEHDSAKVLIFEIHAGGPDDEFYEAQVKVLSEMIIHHVKEEEKKQGNIFAEAKKAGVDVVELGGRLAAEKKTLTAEFKANGIPKPPTPTLHHAKLV